MSEENVAVARKLLDGWSAGDFSSGIETFAPHAVLVVPNDFGEWGVFVGLDRIGKYTRRFMDQFDHVVIEPTDYRISGDTVVVSVVQHGKGKTSGIEMRTPYFILLTFRAGKIVRMESVLREEDALEAAGLSE